MLLPAYKEKMIDQGYFLAEEMIIDCPSVIGYDKKFRFRWMATQLNTFIVVSDFGEDEITPEILECHLAASFKYAEANYKGWPRGLQSGTGVISILQSSKVSEAAKEYCMRLKSGKKWAGITIPVAVETSTKTIYYFSGKPVWGMVYFSYFKKMIVRLLK